MPGKLFGIGLNRTGTMSLNSAPTELGYGAIHFPSDGVTQAEMRAPASDDQPLRLSVLDACDAITDVPAA